ncbi:hypothetical protein PVAP13_6NG008300 [Panicum virgatum]|uniref:Uncharacterized protein n=1 Tax=Panicum virgatum TaxID=38727 RepID=A0A8T0QSQ2_PANVG|nr:hypothetical protein PVAP13_6NG008300 [Panicum virgatum]
MRFGMVPKKGPARDLRHAIRLGRDYGMVQGCCSVVSWWKVRRGPRQQTAPRPVAIGVKGEQQTERTSWDTDGATC